MRSSTTQHFSGQSFDRNYPFWIQFTIIVIFIRNTKGSAVRASLSSGRRGRITLILYDYNFYLFEIANNTHTHFTKKKKLYLIILYQLE